LLKPATSNCQIKFDSVKNDGFDFLTPTDFSPLKNVHAKNAI